MARTIQPHENTASAEPLPALISARAVSRITGEPLSTIYKIARENPELLGAVRLGARKVRFRRAAIDRLIDGDLAA